MRPGKVRTSAGKYFASVANRLDRIREDFFDETIADSILKASDIKPESTVVDVGCGTGFLTQYVAMRAHGNGKIVGRAEIGIFIASGSKRKGSPTP